MIRLPPDRGRLRSWALRSQSIRNVAKLQLARFEPAPGSLQHPSIIGAATIGGAKMRVRSIVFACALSFSALNAADYSAGLKAYQKKDYGTAHKEWGPLAKQGNPDALYGLGTMYDLSLIHI